MTPEARKLKKAAQDKLRERGHDPSSEPLKSALDDKIDEFDQWIDSRPDWVTLSLKEKNESCLN